MVITFTGTKKEEKGLRKKKVLTKVKVAERKLKQQSKGKRNLEIVPYMVVQLEFYLRRYFIFYRIQSASKN